MHIENLTPERIAELKRMSGQGKLKIATSMYWDARREKAAEFRTQYPIWCEDIVQAEVKKFFLQKR